MKVKVVKWCRKKWNEHNMIYIYHKQCEIKIQWNSSNGQLHWFPIDSLWKWSKRDQNYANANVFSQIGNFFGGIQGMPSESWRPGLSENVVVFVAIIFKPELWLLKVNGIWNFGNVSKNKKPFGKITRLQFCVFCSAIESASKHTYWANADSIWKLETQNCSRVIFPNGLTFQLFFFEFWPNFD